MSTVANIVIWSVFIAVLGLVIRFLVWIGEEIERQRQHRRDGYLYEARRDLGDEFLKRIKKGTEELAKDYYKQKITLRGGPANLDGQTIEIDRRLVRTCKGELELTVDVDGQERRLRFFVVGDEAFENPKPGGPQ